MTMSPARRKRGEKMWPPSALNESQKEQDGEWGQCLEVSNSFLLDPEFCHSLGKALGLGT